MVGIFQKPNGQHLTALEQGQEGATNFYFINGAWLTHRYAKSVKYSRLHTQWSRAPRKTFEEGAGQNCTRLVRPQRIGLKNSPYVTVISFVTTVSTCSLVYLLYSTSLARVKLVGLAVPHGFVGAQYSTKTCLKSRAKCGIYWCYSGVCFFQTFFSV